MPNFTYSWFFRTAAILLVSSCLSVFTFRLPTRPWSLHTAAPNRHKILQRHAAGRYEVSSTDFDGEKALPRLNPNTKKLFDWINRCGGATDGAVIMKANDGWSLVAEDFLDINETIVSIPKMICIYADPDLMEYPLLENTQLLMQSLGMRQWRARLAIALLSERTKAGTFFAPYLMNLPWEFNGMPIFFKADEVEKLHDYDLIQSTRKRCQFLGEFTRKVLAPLHNSALDPFAGNLVDINAFGWGFAAASSRALRHGDGMHTASPVLVPLIDLAAHSFTPSCTVVETADAYNLVANRNIEPGQQLTINYGPFSTDEFISDYGFSCDNNPHDFMKLHADALLVNTARAVTGQSNYTASTQLLSEDNAVVLAAGAYSPHKEGPERGRYQPFGRDGDVYTEDSLMLWQKMWLGCLHLHGHDANVSMRIDAAPATAANAATAAAAAAFAAEGVAVASTSSEKFKIDPRLLALMRVLYAASEEELLRHGYDPFSLQEAGSMLSAQKEMHVIRTIIGMAAVLLHSFPSSLSEDLLLLGSSVDESQSRSTALQPPAEADPARVLQKMISECRHIIRNACGTESQQREGAADAIERLCTTAASVLLDREQEVLLLLNAQSQWAGTPIASSEIGAAADASIGVTANKAREDAISKRLFNAMQAAASSSNSNSKKSLRNALIRSIDGGIINAEPVEVLLIEALCGADSPTETGSTAAATLDTIRSAQRIVRSMQKLHSAAAGGSLPGAAGIEVMGRTYQLDEMGAELTANMKEIYKYRIRKKHTLVRVMQELYNIHKRLSEEAARTEGTTTPAGADIFDRVVGLAVDPEAFGDAEASHQQRQQRKGKSRSELLELARSVSSGWATDDIDL